MKGKKTHYAVFSIKELRGLIERGAVSSRTLYGGKVVPQSTVTLKFYAAGKEAPGQLRLSQVNGG